MKEYKITSFDLKLALMQYFRFTRGWLCVTEFDGADVIVDTEFELMEIEVKITKGDLIHGEKKKREKHEHLAVAGTTWRYAPNKFLLCVPESLVDTALVWAAKINPKYGIIAFDTKGLLRQYQYPPAAHIEHRDFIRYARSARSLGAVYNDRIRWSIAKRASAEIASTRARVFDRERQRAINAEGLQ